MLGAPALALALRRALAAASSSTSTLVATAAPSAALASSSSSSSWPRRALSSAAPATSNNENDDAEARLRLANKLVYRAKQRGFLELDLLVGLWAERAIPRMAAASFPADEARRALLDTQELLDAENPDLFKWLTGQEPAPEHMARNSAFADLHAHVKEQMAEHAHPMARASQGAAWTRGWDDAWRKDGGQEGGGSGAGGGDKP
jgi:succinate dehydrogenase flavin-adding protein (antitoxin of CptAB toxin-antitoxin module)